MNRISLCMIVKDEEHNIKRCLQSVQDTVDEMIVLDTGSSDKTVEVARSFGARVESVHWNNHFSDARNASLDLATGEWILILDADEALTAGSGTVLRSLTANTAVDGFWLEIINYMESESCCRWSTDRVLRLFRNRPEYRFRGAIHEDITASIQERNAQSVFSIIPDMAILHYGYLASQSTGNNNRCRILSILKQETMALPDNPLPHYHYGAALFHTGKFVEASRELELAAAEPDSRKVFMPNLLNYLAYSYYKRGKTQQALEIVYKGLELFSDHAGLHLCGGQISYEIKEYGNAYAFLDKYLTLQSKQPDPYGIVNGITGGACLYLGQLAEKFGNAEEALRYYIQGLREHPFLFTFLKHIVRIIRPREDPLYARECLEKLCDLSIPQSQLLMAQVLFDQGEFELALEYYNQNLVMISQLEPSADALRRAVCLIQQEHHLEALKLLDLFTPIEPLYPMAKLNILLSFWFQGNSYIVNMLTEQLFGLGLSADTGAVISLLRDTVNKKEDFSVNFGEKGFTLFFDILKRTLDLGQWKNGQELLGHLDIDCLKEYGLTIGRLWQNVDRLDEAEHYIRLYLRDHSDSHEAYETLADILQRMGSPLEASVYYQQAIVLESKEAAYYSKLYYLYGNLLRDAQAAVHYQDTIANQEPDGYHQFISLYNTMMQRTYSRVAEEFGAAACLLILQS